MTSDEESEAGLKWQRSKQLSPSNELWWGAYLALWSMVGKEYSTDIIFDAAEMLPLSFDHHPGFRQDCREYLAQLYSLFKSGLR